MLPKSVKDFRKKCICYFDQPLCYKAFNILLAAPPDSVFLCVGIKIGFHLLMPFLGTICKIMGGCGLEGMCNTIYTKNTVVRTLSRRQYSRATRAHILTRQALFSIIFQMCPLRYIIHNLEDTFSNILEGSLLLKRLQNVEMCRQFFTLVDLKLKELSERFCDWDLQLFCVQSMLPYFHVGHLNYAKSAHISLQLMLSLRESLPTE
ncbi:hypothetical protein PR048_008712 [Dryococelus australis]|uniref:Uncharacterized protein n=1 Tax=Dryococelus australis TaxID=614101 RepID=A0ABQ9HXX6_9NEOP|nr:hypothetical protein PR048_008712 [Dryococelus australis]